MLWNRRGKKGISILEAILSFLIVSLLMTAVYGILAKGFYGLRFGRNKMDSSQTGLTFLNRIHRELLMSNYKYVEIDDTDPNNPIISFPSPYDDNNLVHRNSFGELLWYKYIFYYKVDNKIWRKYISMGNYAEMSPLMILSEFPYPDGTGSAQLNSYYVVNSSGDISDASAAAYYVDFLSYIKDDVNTSVTITIDVIKPKNKEQGMMSTSHRVVVIPRNTGGLTL